MRLGCSCARSTAAVNPEPRERRREESEGSDWDDDESDDEALRAWESARASESGATTLVDAPAAATMSDDDDDVEDVFATPRAVIAPPDDADEREEIEDAIASTSAPTAPPPSVVVATRSDPRDAYGFDLSDLDGAKKQAMGKVPKEGRRRVRQPVPPPERAAEEAHTQGRAERLARGGVDGDERRARTQRRGAEEVLRQTAILARGRRGGGSNPGGLAPDVSGERSVVEPGLSPGLRARASVLREA
jgi:hypothetical protein